MKNEGENKADAVKDAAENKANALKMPRTTPQTTRRKRRKTDPRTNSASQGRPFGGRLFVRGTVEVAAYSGHSLAFKLLCGRLGNAGLSVSQPTFCSSQISTAGAWRFGSSSVPVVMSL